MIDHTTGLTWHRSGSQKSLTYTKAEKLIRELNDQKFAGFNDWRLPTLEEAMSLMEPTKKNCNLFIDPVFYQHQRYIWTADKKSAGLAWLVGFTYGNCSLFDVRTNTFVRAVR